MSDPISDMIIRIKNAGARRKPKVWLPASKMKEAVARVLLDEGLIADVKRISDAPSDRLEITLKYDQESPAISHFSRVSKPGNRRYRSVSGFPRPLSGHGTVIVSTSQGVMSDRVARQKNVGGEIIATVW